ncbi:MAG: aminotransferase class III-fold pyridoxal phosphate-dependent enzyme [Armatimonadota bacterium]|jgi:glutamate-1-semialdehyde 2,1-aminomutase|nr:aspartate aminotransferase family protein [Armatimonadota bacterium]
MKNLNITKSLELYDRAAKLIPAGTQTLSKKPEMFAFGAFPIYIQKGKGCYVWDVDGNRYLDYIGSLGPIILGYAYPAVNDAVRAQLEDGSIFSLPHPLEVEAAQAVVDVVPCAEMVRFLKTGAEATSAAVRIARGYTGREVVVTSGYHGWLDTWTAAQPAPSDRGIPKAYKESIASFTFGDYDSESSLEAVLNKHKGNVACIMTEATSYAGTDWKDYLQWMRDLADKHDVLLIFDEIVTGFRMALGGAQEYFGVIPDIACFAKGISNGLPVAAVVGKRKYMEAAADLVITSTYGGDALSLAAIMAAIKEYREKDIFTCIRQTGERLISELNKLAFSIGLKLQFRGYPQMSTFSFGYDDPAVNQDLMTLLLQEMAKRGILLRRGGLVFITYSHTDVDIDITIGAAREVFPILKDALDRGNIKNCLLVEKVSQGIRRF